MSVSRFSGGFGLALVAATLLAGSQATAQLPCVGDCNGDGSVAINELITGVNINLGNRPVDDCLAFDANSDGSVAINELIQAVNANLQGCVSDVPTATPGSDTPTATPMADTPTATPDGDTPTPGGATPTETATTAPTSTATSTPVPPTATPTDPLPTDTPNEVVEEVAGAAASVANSLSSIVNIVGAVVTGASGGATSGAALNGLVGVGAGDLDSCELGGTVFNNIETMGLSATITVEFTDCAVSRPGGSVLFNGTLVVRNLGLGFNGTGEFLATIDFRDEQGMLTARTDADLVSPVFLDVSPGSGDCAIETPIGDRIINGFDLNDLSGSLSSIIPGEGTASVTFLGTEVGLDILASDPDCVPTEFDLEFNGDSMISQDADSAAATSGAAITFDLEFVDFLLSAMQSGDQSLITLTGDLVASCFGGTVTLSTPQALSFLLGTFCPGSGTIVVQDIGEVIYSQSGVNAGGMLFSSCLDPALLMCVM